MGSLSRSYNEVQSKPTQRRRSSVAPESMTKQQQLQQQQSRNGIRSSNITIDESGDKECCNDNNILYINVRIRDVSVAVKERVTKRLEKAIVIPNAVIDRAAQKASDMTSPKSVTQTLGQLFCKKFPGELAKKGITAIVDEVFRESTFVVLQVRVQHVDPVTLAASWLTGGGISWFLQSIGADNRKYFEDDYLPTMMTSLLVDYIPTMLEERMSDKKIEAETKVLKPEDQATYFFSKLSQVREEEKHRVSRNPFRRAFSSINSTSSTGSVSRRSGIVGGIDMNDEEEQEQSVGSLSRTSSALSYLSL